MKKLITVTLILALLLPVLALADESDIVGCWACYDMQNDGTPAMFMLYLAEDHTCYFVVQAFHHDEPGIGRAHVGTWEMQSDGSLIAKTGENTTTKLRFYGSTSFAVDKTGRVYVNITEFKLN